MACKGQLYFSLTCRRRHIKEVKAPRGAVSISQKVRSSLNEGADAVIVHLQHGHTEERPRRSEPKLVTRKQTYVKVCMIGTDARSDH